MKRIVGICGSLALLAIGCGGGVTAPHADATPPDPGIDLPLPDAAEVSDVMEIMFPDYGGDPARDPSADSAGDPGEVVVECPGGPGCTCKDNAECNSGFCIETMTGYACTSICQTAEACPKGWVCSVVSTFPDLTYACVDPSANLCRPCTQAEDCASPGTSGTNLCVDTGADGSFCGLACADDSGCPDGFSCRKVGDDRSGVLQCVPTEGACPCTLKFQDKAYKTTCYVQNASGKCLGERTCDSACSAPAPSPETCNNADDDCDGQVDEDVPASDCPLTNDYGTCQGKTLCVGGKEICQGSYPSPEICDGKEDRKSVV